MSKYVVRLKKHFEEGDFDYKESLNRARRIAREDNADVLICKLEVVTIVPVPVSEIKELVPQK